MLFDHNQFCADCGLYFGNDIFPLNKRINCRCVFRQYRKRQIKNTGTGMICTPFTGHPVEGVLLCGTHMSTKGNV